MTRRLWSVYVGGEVVGPYYRAEASAVWVARAIKREFPGKAVAVVGGGKHLTIEERTR